MNETPQRHLPIAGAYNIRDLGGYPTRFGQETLWRRGLRADGLHRIGDAGIKRLVTEGVRLVIDLRYPRELEASPNPFARHKDVDYVNISVFDALAPTRISEQLHPDEDALLALYVEALATRQSAIRQVLKTIADAPAGTVLFHCTAGKDRTGISLLRAL